MDKLKYAKFYIALGLYIFRLKKNAKTPAFSGWQNEATNCSKTAELWFKDTEYNIGILTGERSGVNVIDVDIKGLVDGRKSLEEHYGSLETEHKVLQFKTASGGYHIPVKWTPETDVKNGVNVSGLDGVDIRGNGGFIVASPSVVIIDGIAKSYQVNDTSLHMSEPVGWMKDLLTSHKSKKKLSSKVTNEFVPEEPMIGIKQGSRNDKLFRYASHLRWHGMDKGMVKGFILQAAKLCSPIFPEDEAIQVVNNAFNYSHVNSVNHRSTRINSLEDIL